MTDNYSIKVGKRWFVYRAFDGAKKIADIEASYSNHGGKWLGSDKPPGERFGPPGRDWTITGLGARKYREQIIDHLEERYFDGNPETN